MGDRALKVVEAFLSSRLHPGEKLLLGFSGGPDSLALFHLLLACRRSFRFELHIAHVDHRWREESEREGKILRDLIRAHGLAFHLRVLGPAPSSNRESWGRRERLRFFAALHERHHFRALLLAHHADDQAETLLKRICEGASLHGLAGLVEERDFGSLPIWRPLLPLSKWVLEEYVQSAGLRPFYDQTNVDPTYLRGRMRSEILPRLEASFGKRIRGNFVKWGLLFRELQDYFDEKAKAFLPRLIPGPFGDCLDLQTPFHPLELGYFLRGYARKKGAHFSHDASRLLLDLIARRRVKCRVDTSSLSFIVDYPYLFIISEFPDFFLMRDRWVRVVRGTWVDFWKGYIAYPRDGASCMRLCDLAPFSRKRVKGWYRSHRVPSFLQEHAPLFIRGRRLVGECLTGASFPHFLCDIRLRDGEG